MDVDVRAGMPARRAAAGGWHQCQRDDVLIVRDDLAVGHRQRDGVVVVRRCRHLPDGTRNGPQSREGGVGQTQRDIVAHAA
jgi:hypothetical protein